MTEDRYFLYLRFLQDCIRHKSIQYDPLTLAFTHCFASHTLSTSVFSFLMEWTPSTFSLLVLQAVHTTFLFQLDINCFPYWIHAWICSSYNLHDGYTLSTFTFIASLSDLPSYIINVIHVSTVAYCSTRPFKNTQSLQDNHNACHSAKQVLFILRMPL